MDEEEEIRIESRIAPPPLTCPKCDELLPPELGEVNCLMCESKVKVEHPVTRRKWKDEKVSCPGCEKVLIVGVDSRPANIQCGCLLYTSPSPRDMRRSRMPSSA